MIAATAHTASTGTDWVGTLLSYWWLALIFGGAALEWMGETFNVGLSALHRRSKVRHKRQMALKRMELEIAQAKAGIIPSSLPTPGPCVHRNVIPVVAADESVTAWLCKSCDAQLPADWAVREEDL
jgi:hypothetical protein